MSDLLLVPLDDIVVFDAPGGKPKDDRPLPARVVRSIGQSIGLAAPSTDEYIKRVVALPGDRIALRDGRIVLNEVNTLPGLTSYSRYPRMMAAAGMPLAEVIDADGDVVYFVHRGAGTLETDYELMTHLQPGRENILALQARVGHLRVFVSTPMEPNRAWPVQWGDLDVVVPHEEPPPAHQASLPLEVGGAERQLAHLSAGLEEGPAALEPIEELAGGVRAGLASDHAAM